MGRKPGGIFFLRWEKYIDLEEEHAPTVQTKVALFVPQRGETALYFSEYCGRDSGGAKLLTCFARHFSQLSNDTTMTRNRVIDSEAWNQSSTLRQVEVKTLAKSPDLADAADSVYGTISHVLRPRKNMRLSLGWVDQFRKNPQRAYELLDVNESHFDGSEQIWITVEGEHTSKRILLNDPNDGLWFRELLTENGKPSLTGDEFVERREAWSTEYLPRIDQQWLTEWSI